MTGIAPVLTAATFMPEIRTAVNDAPDYLEKLGLTTAWAILTILVSILVLIIVL